MPRLLPVCLGLLLLLTGTSAFAEKRDIPLADGRHLAVYLLMPPASEREKPPLVVMMPGGSGEDALARDLQYWLGEEFVQRGFAVVIPVSPNGRSFRGVNNALIPMLIDAMQETFQIGDDKPLLVGISNGGMSAVEIAAATPERFRGIVAVPALVPRGLDISALAGMPIYLRIGDQDEMSWSGRLEETADTLRAAGAQVDAGLVFMAPHMFQMEWETLDPWLAALPTTP